MTRPPKIALLANPKSGSGEAEDAAAVIRREGAEVEVFSCDQPEEAATSGAARLVVAGGDGSLASAAVAAGKAGVELAVIPAGTANDFARETELPRDAEEAACLAVGGSETRALDIGWMGDRPFLNVVSAGLSPAAAREAVGFKQVLGALAYAAGALRAGVSAKPLHCRVSCDGAVVFDGEAWQVSVACTGGFGGGSSFDADPADGRLDVVVIPSSSRLRLIRRALGMRMGTVGDQEPVDTHRCTEAELEVREGTPFNLDGELIRSGSARFTVDPGAFRLVVG